METQDRTIETSKWPQFLTAFIASITTVCSGAAVGWTSPSLPYLRWTVTTYNESIISYNVTDSANSDDYLTDDECSLVGSLMPVGALFGALSAGFICEKIGTKTTLQITGIPLVTGWIILCSVGRNAVMIFVARVLHGLVVGVTCVAVPLYNEEIAEVKIRGAIGVFYEMSVSLGILLVNIFGAVTSYFWLNISCVILALISIFGLFFVPESPVYLVKKCQTEKAKNSLMKLRGVKREQTSVIAFELMALQSVVDAARQRTEEESQNVFKLSHIEVKIFKSLAAKSCFIVMILMILRIFSGSDPFTMFTVNVFEGSGSNMSPFTSSVICRFCSLVFCLLASSTVDRFGRRTLLLTSNSIMIVSLIVLVVYFYLKTDDYNLQSITWLPTVCVVIFLSMFAFGIGSLPFLIMAEIVPTESKKWITGVCCMVHWLCVVIDSSLYFVMTSKLGFSGMFLYYSIINMIGFILIFLFVPETKNKSVEIIHDELQKNVFHYK